MAAEKPNQPSTRFAPLVRGAKAVQLAWECAPRLAFVWMLLLGISAVLPLAMAWVGKRILDAAITRHTREALLYVLCELGIAVLLGATMRGASALRGLMSFRLGFEVNLRILNKTLSLSLPHFQDPAFYDQLNRAKKESGFRPVMVTAEVLGLGAALITLIGSVLLLLSFEPLAFLVMVLAAFPAAIAEVRYSRHAFELRNRRSQEGRRLSYLEYILTSDEHAKEVLVLGVGPTLFDRYKALGETLFHEEQSLTVRRLLAVTFLSQLGTLAYYGCYVVIVYRAVTGALPFGDMALYAIAFQRGQQAFQAVLFGIGALYEHDLYLSNLFDFLALPTGTETKLLPAHSASAQNERGIRFENLGFRYPGQDRFVLRNLNLWIPAGQSLALVGPNGAGKTTFIKLLTGLYPPTEGRVLLDGQDLQTLPQDLLRKRLAVVFQDFNQYHFTAFDNVALGDPQRKDDQPRVLEAIEQGGAKPVVDKLPQGLSTQLGRWFENGVDLPGGQWQRIALSRALMRRDADIVVLDEPTAALDVEAEAEVFERVRELQKGRTLILISHRFPTVRRADHIIVLEQDGIAEQGSHAELLAREGLYASMFHKQAKGYL
jgi:ATP-binding cassette subfamily B protein